MRATKRTSTAEGHRHFDDVIISKKVVGTPSSGRRSQWIVIWECADVIVQICTRATISSVVWTLAGINLNGYADAITMPL